VTRLGPYVLAILGLAGCAKNSARPTATMRGPTAVAVYRGYGMSQPGVLRHLVAVANTRGDDLRVIDAVSDKVELGPTLVAALSVPTDPRPSVLAAGRLEDVDADLSPVARPDLLVVAPAGLVARPNQVGQFAASIQVVVTWEDVTRVGATIDLGDVAPGAGLVSMTVCPGLGPDGNGKLQRMAGAALVVAGLDDGSLITLSAKRVEGSEAIELQAPLRQELGFTALDLAVPPDVAHLYAATTEHIPPSGTLGVAELDLAGTVGALAIRAISVGAGTTRVAATDVAPFLENDATAVIPDLDKFGPAVPRVLAAVDNQSCGRDRSVPCGVALLDPVAGGMAPDPAGELPFQMPMAVDGDVVAIAVSGPPQVSSKPGYVELAPASGRRWTQSFAAISASSGRVYIADLSHFALANDVSSLTGSAATRVITAGSYRRDETSNFVGVWQLAPPTGTQTEWPLLGDAKAVEGVGVTPGFTPSETWTVAYQGVLPGLGSRLGLAWVPGGGPQAPTWVALQEATGLAEPGSKAWRSVVRVYDPRLAIRIGDIVEVSGFPAGVCPLGQFDLLVTALLPPAADTPGGSIAVAPAANQPIHAGQVLPADPTCLPAGAAAQVTITVRGSGYVAAGNGTGYVGRPVEVIDPADPLEAPFQVRYESEGQIPCPIMPDSPEEWPPAPSAVASCEADVNSCRASCERLVVARRARRIFYVTNRCGQTTEPSCYTKWQDEPLNLVFPLPNGPVLTFKVGVIRPNGGDAPPARGNFLLFTTGSGLVPSVRIPYQGSAARGAVLPGGVVLYDRTAATGLATDGIHGFATFIDNLVLDFASGSAAQNSTTIR
jgi:hypothetical protein